MRKQTSGQTWQRQSRAPGGEVATICEPVWEAPSASSRSLAHLKREIAEKKWTEARRRTQVRVTSRKYKLPNKRRSDTMAARSRKGLASRYYHLKSGCVRRQAGKVRFRFRTYSWTSGVISRSCTSRPRLVWAGRFRSRLRKKGRVSPWAERGDG